MSALRQPIALESPVAQKSDAASACRHCGAPVAAGSAGAFCCHGCATAYAIVNRLGLGQFYLRRQWVPGVRPLTPQSGPPVRYADHARAGRDGESTLELMVDGLHCGACVWLIESVLAREPGALAGRVNLSTRRLTIRWRGGAEQADRFAYAVTALGFRVAPFDPRLAKAAEDDQAKELLRALAVAGFAAGNVMLLSVSVWAGAGGEMGTATRDLFHWLSALIALPAIAYGGQPFFRSAVSALRAGRTNMDVPISIGVLLASAMSLHETFVSGAHAYFDSAITLLFFLLAGRYFDTRARGLARASAAHLLALASAPVRILRAGGTIESQRADTVAVGDVVLVAAGERIGVDGDVRDGISDVDTSLITGESAPVAAGVGTHVSAGTINLTAPLQIAVTATGSRTLLAEIVRLMEAAESGKARYVALADRVARRYAPVVHLLAATTFLIWYFATAASWQESLLNAVAVLIITCPCALALAVPTVQVVAVGRLLRRGIMLKSATALERLARVDTVVFDKTGTLTSGRASLRDIGAIEPEDLRLAAGIARASRHPLARALAAACPEAPLAAGAREHPGRGLNLDHPGGPVRLGNRAFCGIARGDHPDDGDGPELWLARPGRPPVRFAFADRLRDDAAAVVRGLIAHGYAVELLSGDRPSVVAEAARAAGIPEWRALQNPVAKCTHLAELRNAGRVPLMVGDGLNDAPALSAAAVSISPSTAADISQTAADVVFQGDRLAPVAEALAVSHAAERLTRQNLALALIYNLLAVPLAMLGLVTPLIAAAAMSTSSLLVVGNSLRLKRTGRPWTA